MESKSANSAVVGGKVGQAGIPHVESTVVALMDILHAFVSSDPDMIPTIGGLYVGFLLSSNIQVSFASKQALIRILRPKVRRRRVATSPIAARAQLY
ncbi:Protein purity of essencelike [Caligus rogercresseyi]|uniref:Protein purity of essencelike n=1 Tax=Caligus rogercresseyi TaxID=217165 RepID=A0A7T8JXZ0_CALRO|nr:Protein purity of essencelike [Caligus rogercresseyi]